MIDIDYTIFSDKDYIMKVIRSSNTEEHYKACKKMRDNWIKKSYPLYKKLSYSFMTNFICLFSKSIDNKVNNYIKLLDDCKYTLDIELSRLKCKYMFKEICGIGFKVIENNGKVHEADPIDFIWYQSYDDRDYDFKTLTYNESENKDFHILYFKIDTTKKEYFEQYDKAHGLFRYKHM